MTEALRRRLWLLAFFLLCSGSTLLAGWEMHAWGDRLSQADAYSESNALREVDGFRAQGIWHDAGLGNVLFGNRFAAWGFAGHPDDLSRSVSPNGIYTHYPPGPEYLLYVAEALFGPAPVARARVLPLLLCWGAAVFFGFSIRRRFGPAVGWLVMAACLSVPSFWNANSSVHFLGYALALLLVEIGIGLRRNRAVLPYLLLGFAQGWLSFDYAFLVVLIPLALELALPRIAPGEPARVRLALARCVAAGCGFTLAHLLHFAQVWAYYGTLAQALADLHGAAAYRAGSDEYQGAVAGILKALVLVGYYVVSPYPVYRPDAGFMHAAHIYRFLGLTLGVWWAIGTVAAFVLKARGQRAAGGGWQTVHGLGLLTCSVWWLAMQNHATIHVHLLFRHLFFLFFLCVLYWAVRLATLFEPAPPGTP